MDEADIDFNFYHRILNITKKENRLVGLSKISNKNSFNLKICQFDCSTIQQKYSLSEEITLTRRELGVVLDCLNDFLLQFEAARQSNYYTLPTPKAPIGYTFLTSFFVIIYTRSGNSQNGTYDYRFDSNWTRTGYFFSKNLLWLAAGFSSKKFSICVTPK